MITLSGAGAIIRDSDGNVLLVRIERNDMVRWELPTGIRQKGESLFLTLYRCIEKESPFDMKVRIGRPVCLGVNISKKLGHQYYAMFFECETEESNIKPIKDEEVDMPDKARQKIIDTKFLDWQSIAPKEIHPQHREILNYWSDKTENSLFSVISNADSELEFYCQKGEVDFTILHQLNTPDKYFINKADQKDNDVHSYQENQSVENNDKEMADQPEINLSGSTFHGPVNISSPNYGKQAENINIYSKHEGNFEFLLTDFKRFIKELKYKYPNIHTLQEVMKTINIEAAKSTPNPRLQDFINLRRLWKGGKKATLKVSEHFAENNVWGKGAIAFLEGVSEDVD